MNEMTTGHQVAMVAVGSDGVIGLGPLFSVPYYPHRLVALADTTGYRLQVARLSQMFHGSETLRRLTLAHVGRVISDLSISAACHRAHSHRQRLARWLLIATDKAEQRWLQVTHETLAHMVGGPRHAVTVALNELRAKGAIAHLRGRVEVLKRSVLVAHACECYARREPPPR
jgi:CRP-like cAMP-binding protein